MFFIPIALMDTGVPKMDEHLKSKELPVFGTME